MKRWNLLALVGGARGIGYFACAFEPFRWKLLTREVEREIARTNRELSEQARFLVRPTSTRVHVSSRDERVRCAVRSGPGRAARRGRGTRTSGTCGRAPPGGCGTRGP